jgi:hypothetical protein
LRWIKGDPSKSYILQGDIIMTIDTTILKQAKTITCTKAFENITDRITVTNRHMKRLGGKLHGDAIAWEDIFHSQNYSDHMNHYIVASRLIEEERTLCHRFNLEQQDINVVYDRNENSQEIMKKYKVEYNRPVFKSWMSTVDVINKIIKEEQTAVKAGNELVTVSLIRSLIRDSIYEANEILDLPKPTEDHKKVITFGPNDMFEIEISVKVKPNLDAEIKNG